MAHKKDTLAIQMIEAVIERDGMLKVAAGLDVSVSHLYRLLNGERGPGFGVAALALSKYKIPLPAWSQRGMSEAELKRMG